SSACEIGRTSMSTPDPILAALDLVNAAEQEHVTACSDLDESDEAAMHRCNAACDRAATARRELTQIVPTTMGGLQSLAAHYCRWGETGAEESFSHLARSLRGVESNRPLRPSEEAESLSPEPDSIVNRTMASDPPCAGAGRVNPGAAVTKACR
ncbi:hypothetical protein, partial [Methylobacterium sp. J-068]|uniref:hypothetical protein n=1 Tax=Methylobacterium sp. J-068 TaxID=2836649 RepID=UPI001FBB3768